MESGRMQWQSDVSVGEELAARLDEAWGSLHSVVPRGFAAYARVLHRPRVRTIAGGAWPTPDEWARFTPEQFQEVSARVRDEPTTWGEAAAAWGTTLHPLAQWDRIVRMSSEGDRYADQIAPDGREFTRPEEGQLDAATLAIIAAHLVPEPVPGYVGLWNGYGGLLGGYGSTGRVFFGWGEGGDPQHDPEVAARHAAMLNTSVHDPFNNVFRRPTWTEGILSREISEGPMLELPDRSYVLFHSDLSSFTDPHWIRDAPWRDRPAEEHGFEIAAQSPNLIWPVDLSWIVVSEIDVDSTVVGGSPAQIAALVADPRIEAFPLSDGADLTWDADDINRP